MWMLKYMPISCGLETVKNNYLRDKDYKFYIKKRKNQVALCR